MIIYHDDLAVKFVIYDKDFVYLYFLILLKPNTQHALN